MAMPMCFLTYQEDTSSEEDCDDSPSDVAGLRKCLGQASEMKAYCPCGKGLRRVAKLPGRAMYLACSSSSDCSRCDEVILPGDLHFRCKDCEDTRVCKGCGPGVFIERTFDFFDPSTGENEVQEIPQRVLHYRKARQQRRKNKVTRGLSLRDGQEEDEAAFKMAEQVLRNAEIMMKEVIAEGVELLDKDWHPEGALLRLLGVHNQIQACDMVRLILSAVIRFWGNAETLQDVKAPCKVYGDTHGQLRDILLLWGSFGVPGTPECPSVVFNGDFVDRGKHQVEVMCLLFCLKIVYPSNVFLNRGNHEDQHMNQKYGFQKAIMAALGEERGQELYELTAHAFCMLPLASLVEDKVLIVHGGIGDGKWSIDELRKVRRPLKHADLAQDKNQWLWNLLWSDPIEDDEKSGSSQVFGVHSSPRGKMAVKFGWNVTQAFCAKNGLDLIVRSHQAKKSGLGFDVMHNDSLVRVFSARDYEGHNNDCAILSITDEGEDEDATSGVLTVRPQVLSSICRS